MLKPYVFAVCEKVLLDANGVASLIALFTQVDAHRLASSTETVPHNAVVPMSWFVFTSWQHDPEDVGKEFCQVTQILYPDGSIFQEHSEKFEPQIGKTHYQVTLNMLGFPIGQEGNYQVRMKLNQNGATLFESESIKIIVKHHLVSSGQANP